MSMVEGSGACHCSTMYSTLTCGLCHHLCCLDNCVKGLPTTQWVQAASLCGDMLADAGRAALSD